MAIARADRPVPASLRRLVFPLASLLALALLVACARPGPGDQAGLFVNVYTARHYGVEPVFEAFTQDTGINVRFTTGSDSALRERIKAEGRFTPADVYVAVDAGNLWLAGEDGLLQPVDSKVLADNIPPELRDPGNRWFGLSQRVRTIVYHPDRVAPEELSTYEGLADARWKGRLIMRPATHPYT